MGSSFLFIIGNMTSFSSLAHVTESQKNKVTFVPSHARH
jgi:hypothetical protein